MRVYGDAIITPIGRFSWPALDVPRDPPPPKPGETPGKPRYEVNLLLPKEDKTVLEFKARVEAISADMITLYNANSQKSKLAGGDVFRDGDSSDKEKYPYDLGNWVMTARNTTLPDIYDVEKNTMEGSVIKGGMLGRLIVIPHLGATGMSYKMEIVQLLKDDNVRFGGGKPDYLGLLDAIDMREEFEELEEAQNESVPVQQSIPAVQTQPSVRAQIAQKLSVQKGGKGKSAAHNLL